jgi:hypothetical protein
MFTEDTTLAKILESDKGRKVLRENGVPCLSCAMAAGEINFLKIGQVADMYGLDKEKIMKELNG